LQETIPKVITSKWYCAFIYAVALCITTLLGVPSKCLAQDDMPRFPRFTAFIGGSPTDLGAHDLNSGYGLLAGGGVKIGGSQDANSVLYPRWWSVYLTGNFMFNDLGIKSSDLQSAIIANPQIPGLLSATSGTAKFYSTTFGPTLRFQIPRASYINIYVLAGGGWMRRTLDFTGAYSQSGSILPSSPVVASIAESSGAFDAGAGISFGPLKRATGVVEAAGTMLYIEVRFIHGLGINSPSTFWPLSVGVRW
jgi:hypothetical protein